MNQGINFGEQNQGTAPQEEEQLAPSILADGNITIAGETRKQIDQKVVELKAKFGVKKVYVIIVQGYTDTNEKPYYIGYFRRPNMMHFSQYMSFVQKDPVQANFMLAKNVFLDGDRELIDDEDMFLYGTMQQLGSIIDSRNSDMVKK